MWTEQALSLLAGSQSSLRSELEHRRHRLERKLGRD
jgi:hypothetical protein